MKKKYSKDDIQVLTSREAVRLRPSIHLSKIFKEGNLDSLPLEVACHAIDEYHDENCSTIEITVHDDYFSVNYDAGMSLDKTHGEFKAVTIMTSLFACRNEKKHLAVGEKFCELGIATVNFCSEYCSVNTVWNGLSGQFKFEQGKLLEQHVEECQNESEWTELVFKPDPEIFGELPLSFAGVKQLVDEVQGALTGLTIKLTDATSAN